MAFYTRNTEHGGMPFVCGGGYWTNHSSRDSRATPNLLPEPLTDEQRAEIRRVRAKLEAKINPTEEA